MLNRDSVRDVDVSITSTEEAAKKDNVEYDGASGVTVASGGDSSKQIWNNSGDDPQYIDEVFWAIDGTYSDDILVIVQLWDDTGTLVDDHPTNPAHFPLVLNSPIKVPSGYSIEIRVINNSANSIDYWCTIQHRPFTDK